MKKHLTILFSALFTGIMAVSWLLPFTAQASGKQAPRIALLMDALYTDRWYKDRDYFLAKAESLGATVDVFIANSDANKQIDQAYQAIDQGAKALVVVPTDATAASEIVDIAHEAGVKVIAYDRMIMHTDLDAYVSFDNVKVGELQASFALKAHPTGKYAIISGPRRDNNTMSYLRGQMNVLQPYIDRGDVNLVNSSHAGEWAEMEGYMFASELLMQHPDMDVIIAANDMLAKGVEMALLENGLSGQVFVTGQDATVDACQMLIDGTLGVTIYKPINQLAEKAAKVAVQAASGENITTATQYEIPGFSVPACMLDVIAVTKDNIQQTVIESGHIDAADLSF